MSVTKSDAAPALPRRCGGALPAGILRRRSHDRGAVEDRHVRALSQARLALITSKRRVVGTTQNDHVDAGRSQRLEIALAASAGPRLRASPSASGTRSGAGWPWVYPGRACGDGARVGRPTRWSPRREHADFEHLRRSGAAFAPGRITPITARSSSMRRRSRRDRAHRICTAMTIASRPRRRVGSRSRARTS